MSDAAVLGWLESNHEALVADLAALVAVKSISTDGGHQKEIGQCAELVCSQMKAAGLQNVGVLKTPESNPYAYGEWLGAPGKPTVFLYAHHDVQPVNDVGAVKWQQADPFKLERREGRLFGRGSADDKGAITAQLGPIAAYLNNGGKLPVNVKMLVEGEEEVGSKNLLGFFEKEKARLKSDVIVVFDTENIEVGLPCITYSLRGIVEATVEVQSAGTPVHSGMAGGALADAALALNVILFRLYWSDGRIPVPGLYDQVRALSAVERESLNRLPVHEDKWRKDMGVLPGVRFANPKGAGLQEATTRLPSATIIAQEASSIQGRSNQVLPRARAVVSCRIVPDMDPETTFQKLKACLTADPPWGVQVSVTQSGNNNWWMTDPSGPAFDVAMKSLEQGFKAKPAMIGCGGSIGFVGPLAALFGGAPALLLGIEDPQSNPHAPNESLHEGDWKSLMRSLVYLFRNLGELPGGKVKA
jgi:acetylornithine deacetylase/succinyl-diaminopimelate desuccinylase-like protein